MNFAVDYYSGAEGHFTLVASLQTITTTISEFNPYWIPRVVYFSKISIVELDLTMI